MRGYLTRRFTMTKAKIGYYDMSDNKMVKCKTIAGKWKTADQVQKYCKKHREELNLPKDKQITVLGMETETELRRMSHEAFYELSEPVPEKKYSDTVSVKATKTNINKKKGKKK